MAATCLAARVSVGPTLSVEVGLGEGVGVGVGEGLGEVGAIGTGPPFDPPQPCEKAVATKSRAIRMFRRAMHANLQGSQSS